MQITVGFRLFVVLAGAFLTLLFACGVNESHVHLGFLGIAIAFIGLILP
jgi:hypothetical protein